MPIRHGLPTHALAEETTEAQHRATPETGDDQTTQDTKSEDGKGEDSKGWPAGPALEQIKWLSNRLEYPTIPEAVFDLTAPLAPAADYPDTGGLTLPFARAQLISLKTPQELADRVWRFIIEAARAKRGAWNLFVLGMGVRGLEKAAGRLAPGKTSTYEWIWYVDQSLAAEFVMRIHGDDTHHLNIEAPRVYLRLRDQCVYAVKGDWRALASARKHLVEYEAYSLTASKIGGLDFERISNDMYARRIYPDGAAFLALLRLVRANKISKEDAALIGYTSVLKHTVADAGTWLGMNPTTARGRHHRAKDLIGRLLDPLGRYRADKNPST